jgi:glycerophosphoryl diester phosphodiesterase
MPRSTFVRSLLAAGFGLAALVTFAAERAPAKTYKLIAHRGGVVEEKLPDNSFAALKAAAARGYVAVECDIRETKDGVLVMQHDPDLKLNFGDPRKIFETTWEELGRLRTKVADQPLRRFDEWVQAARDAGLQLMLDSKDPHSPDFPAKVGAVLKKYDMVANCTIVGTGDAMNHFTGKAPVGYKFRGMKARVEADPAAKERIFLFDEGRNLTAEMVQWALANGVRVVASVNFYHYFDAATMTGKSRAELETLIFPQARKHIETLKALGVTEFQIDSEFDRWF